MFAALRSPAVLMAILATGLAIAPAWAVELHHPPTTQENLNFIWIILCAALVFFMCRIPSDHIPIRSWPLFLARELMRDLIETLKAEQST